MKNRVIWLVVVGLGVLIAGLRIYPMLEANITRMGLVKGQAVGNVLQASNEDTWDAGWHQLCQVEATGNGDSTAAKPDTLSNVTLADIDRGAYLTAQAALDQAAAEGWINQVPNAAAYHAALHMKWTEAANLYQSEKTPRLDRWWGTVFYLAAQQLMFGGKIEEAAGYYRQADALYDTQGPYLGLAVAECLRRQNRLTEAWDAMRRALVALPVDEALAHQQEFEALRLAALEQWQKNDPQNEQVQRWLAFYRATKSADEAETLSSEPTPQVKLEADLGKGRKLIGFDYRVEDIQTGPYLAVDFYLRDGERILRTRRTVLNQTPNGAFTWDAVPDGVRPVGWHGYVYDHTPEALTRREAAGAGWWLCLINRQGNSYFGTQSSSARVKENAGVYLQGGENFGQKNVALGRNWAGPTSSAYSYTPGGRASNAIGQMSGVWLPSAETQTVTVWVLSENGCVRNLYLFAVPTL